MTTRDGINASLKIIGLAGLTGVAIVAPNALQGFNLLTKKSSKNLNRSRVLTELKRQGLVHITHQGSEFRYTITPAGAHRLQQSIIDELNIEIPKKWDKKWRIVTFDIPVQYSKQRAYFTARLQSFGFMMLQKSMWVHPASCLEQVEQLAAHYNVMRYCTLLEVGRMDELSTQRLLRHFKALHT